jgi:hypothetical protein
LGAQSVSVSLAVGAMTLVGAIVGSMLTYSVAAESVSKDYVQIATTILTNEKSSPELRTWSIAVLDTKSPVPFTAKQKEELSERGILGAAVVVPQSKIDLPDGVKAPCRDVLAGNPPATREFLFQVLREYGECRARHNVTLEYVAQLNRSIDEQNARNSVGNLIGLDRWKEAEQIARNSAEGR